MYLGEPLCYQSSNNLPQTAQTLDFLPMVSLSLPEKYKIFHLRRLTSNCKKSIISIVVIVRDLAHVIVNGP